MAVAAGALVLGGCSAGASPAATSSSGSAGGAGAVASIGATTGSGSGGGGAAKVTDPCTLLTQAEVAGVVGKPVGAGSSADNPNSCDFQYPADVPDIQAGVNFIDGTLDDFCKDIAGASAVGMTIEPVSGIGDGACFIYVGKLRAGSSLTFSKGGRLFQTFADLGPASSTADMKTADTKLAQAVLSHLQ